ncbi:hypothetical protein [Candidatus Methylomirabilis sp.]|uniref:5' nucleotidase, NT5C type n=1 Tax=Candidatus Methylomirabilis sp. TaxID=2032687 RepID=UPI002A5F74EA|nr:hypothetical protein [Candidatus Methylomirabilis sp.]
MKIGIDLDDVLADSLPHYLQAFNRHFGLDIEVTHAAWRIADRFPHIPRQEADDFFTELIEDGFFSSRPLFPGAKEAVEVLAEDGHRLYIITGRSPQEEPITRRWLTHVGVSSYFEAVMHRVREPVGHHKSSAASALQLDLFIEDELAVALAVSETAIPVLLFDHPWNQGPLSRTMCRVQSWGEALTRIAELNGGNGHR